jgi:hypothetical protein
MRFAISCRHGCARQEAKIAFDKGQLDQPEVVEGQLLIACRNRMTLFQPAHALFDRTATAILDTIIGHRPTTFAFPLRRLGGMTGLIPRNCNQWRMRWAS